MCKPPEVSLKIRWLLYTAAWGAEFLSFFIPTLLERRIPDREQILLSLIFSWLFPTGLAAWFNHPKPLDDTGLTAVLWFAYLVHGFFTLRSRTWVRFCSLLLILAIVLVFNVLGCHRIKINPRALGQVEPGDVQHVI